MVVGMPKDVQVVINNLHEIYFIKNIKGYAEVYFGNNQMVSTSLSVSQLLSLLCLQFGSTLQGRKKAIAKAINIRQKVPVLISEYKKVILFPTCGSGNDDCIWISANNCLYLKKHDKYYTNVLFKDGSKEIFPFDHRILKQQCNRCYAYFQFLDK